MKRMTVLNRLGELRKIVSSLPPVGGALNTVVVYEDAQTRNWARSVHEQLQAIAAGTVATTWWKLEDLGQPGVLAGAVSKAFRADIVVIAVRGREGLPLPFYVWVNSWLTHRGLSGGALIALLAGSPERQLRAERVREHLQAVAQKARMKLILEELPPELLFPELYTTVTAESDASIVARRRAPKTKCSVRVRVGGPRRNGTRNVLWSALVEGGLARWAGI